jgi:hypothetical protein
MTEKKWECVFCGAELPTEDMDDDMLACLCCQTCIENNEWEPDEEATK